MDYFSSEEEAELTHKSCAAGSTLQTRLSRNCCRKGLDVIVWYLSVACRMACLPPLLLHKHRKWRFLSETISTPTSHFSCSSSSHMHAIEKDSKLEAQKRLYEFVAHLVYTAVSTNDVNSSTSAPGMLFLTVNLEACKHLASVVSVL